MLNESIYTLINPLPYTQRKLIIVVSDIYIYIYIYIVYSLYTHTQNTNRVVGSGGAPVIQIGKGRGGEATILTNHFCSMQNGWDNFIFNGAANGYAISSLAKNHIVNLACTPSFFLFFVCSS